MIRNCLFCIFETFPVLDEDFCQKSPGIVGILSYWGVGLWPFAILLPPSSSERTGCNGYARLDQVVLSCVSRFEFFELLVIKTKTLYDLKLIFPGSKCFTIHTTLVCREQASKLGWVVRGELERGTCNQNNIRQTCLGAWLVKETPPHRSRKGTQKKPKEKLQLTF